MPDKNREIEEIEKHLTAEEAIKNFQNEAHKYAEARKQGKEYQVVRVNMFKEMTDSELLDFCEDKFCDYDVCEALKCSENCCEEDCPLTQLFDRFRKYTEVSNESKTT